jgi:hypothetical protein
LILAFPVFPLRDSRSVEHTVVLRALPFAARVYRGMLWGSSFVSYAEHIQQYLNQAWQLGCEDNSNAAVEFDGEPCVIDESLVRGFNAVQMRQFELVHMICMHM